MHRNVTSTAKPLLRRLGLASARTTTARPSLRDGFFADAERVEDDYPRLRRPHE
jgi:hypothetical protein